MAICAEAADVAVLVRAATAQRYDMVRNGGFPNDASASAVPAERFGLQAPQPPSDCAATTQSLGHVDILASGGRAQPCQNQHNLGGHDLFGALAYRGIMRRQIASYEIGKLVHHFLDCFPDVRVSHVTSMCQGWTSRNPETNNARKRLCSGRGFQLCISEAL